jgi:two-component system response regulator YesN
VLHYVEHHYNEDLSLDSVASKINLSSGYLSNYIKQKTGVTFSEHIMEVRIRKAKEMLRDSSLPIGVIAEKIGYYSATSFNRWFKKATGLSPGEYRRQSTLKH